MEPKILISGPREGSANYERAVCLAGGQPCARYCPTYEERYAGLVLAGGDDIDPALFGQENHGSQGIDPCRDQAELALAEAFFQARKPILAICRGHQMVNVALGGTLIQDISRDLRLFHTRDKGSQKDKIHPIRTEEHSQICDLLGSVCQVTSAHHQAVERLGRGLTASAWSESGLVEAMEHTSLPLLSVQFHPERMCGRTDTADGLLLFRRFIRLCS